MEAKNSKSSIFFIATATILLIVIGAVTINYIKNRNQDKTAQEIYPHFTCSCCEGSLAEAPDSCFMAGGMRGYIDALLEAGFDGNSAMFEAVKKFGVPTLVNSSMQSQYGLVLLNMSQNKSLLNVPQIVITPNEINLGNVNESAWTVIIADFAVANNGTSDLIIYDLKTSCSCLTASFIIDGKESVRVGRFSNSMGWNAIIKPGETAVLRTYYDAKVTDWQTGHVERIVTITSNDPVYFMNGAKIIAFLVK